MRLYALDTLDKINDRLIPTIETDNYKREMKAPVEPVAPAQGAQEEGLLRIPDAEVLMQRLETYVGSALIPYMAQKLYPRILKMAGRELYPIGVAVGITLAVHDACEGLPPMIASMTRLHFPALVEALVPDEKLHAEILEALNG